MENELIYNGYNWAECCDMICQAHYLYPTWIKYYERYDCVNDLGEVYTISLNDRIKKEGDKIYVNDSEIKFMPILYVGDENE